jgi:uncharacterized membrane protein YagU involved in acid resistance
MKRLDFVKQVLLPGALAGLAGGLIFGLAMSQLGVLPTVASLVRTDSAVVGFIVHMVIAAIVGAGFGVLVWHQRAGAGETLLWGLTYGTLWWFLGPLTLLPLLLGNPLAWDLPAAQAAFPSLLGHLWYGATTGLAYVTLRRRRDKETRGQGNKEINEVQAVSPDHPVTMSWGHMLRGALAGLLGGWLLGAMLDAQSQLLALWPAMTGRSHIAAWLVTLLIGLLAGLGYALLYPRPTDSAGVNLIRGTAYGFAWWVAGALTLMPLVGGAGLTWTVDAARAGFATLPGYLLFGAIVALIYKWLDALVQLLFSDMVSHDDEGVGAQGLRALGRGALAGLVGGLLFTLVMIRVGFLPIVASLIGSTSALTGFIVHLVIADLIGASYGLLFRRQSYDLGSALGWGVAYGFFWWILGPLTLMPILLGVTPQWTVEVAAGLSASLIGHLAYGAGLGIIFYLLEARYNPWWVSRTQMEAARVAHRREQVLTSAPALWVLMVVIALTLPVVLGM